jgi:hypothetical protein
MRNRIGREFHLVLREILHHQSRQVSIFTQGKQILLVQGINIRFGVRLNDERGDDDGSTLVGCPDSID